jgi:hypothetical protein
VDWQQLDSLPANTAYFHARYRQALPPPAGAPYDILRVAGRGFYVGTVLNAIQVAPGWFGEGDDLFYVDGHTSPDMKGTGTEDYFNDAWSFRIGSGPYTGVTVADGTDTGARMTAYRWHLLDPVPFTTSLQVAIEHAGWTFNPDGSVRSAFEERPDLFSSVAYWYQQGIATDQPEPPYGAARLPQGNATQIEIENYLNDAKVQGGTASVQKEVFWSKDLLFFDATGPGSRIDVPLDVPGDGRYEVIAQVGEAPDYGTYTVEIDGKTPGASGQLEHEPGANTGGGVAIDGYYTEVFVGDDRVIAWPTLSRGRHWVSFICTGKDTRSSGYNLGLDGLVLSHVAGQGGLAVPDSATAANPADRMRRIGARGPAAADQLSSITTALAGRDPMLREAAAWTMTQLGRAATPAVAVLGGALEDPDPVVRGLVAIALANVDQLPDVVTDDLGRHLKDPDENDRMVVANALAAHPASAKRVMAQLIAAAQVPSENRHVLRSIAVALGSIGPDARSALPVLRELDKQPLVRWQVEWAIKQITGVR